jgi:chemotaxis protein MotB
MSSNHASAMIQSRRPDTRRDTTADPWRAAAAERPSEQSGWLLSYLDVMTLLFSFFVFLFAYQKALTVEAKTAHPETATQSTQVAASIPVSPAVIEASKTISTNRAPASPPVRTAQDRNPIAEAEIKVYPAYPDAARTVSALSRREPEYKDAIVEATPPAQKAEETSNVAGPSSKPVAAAPEKGWIAEAGDMALNAAASLDKAFSDADLGGSVEISAASGEVRLEINDAILFDPASAELKPEGASVLDRLASVLGAQGGTIEVEGHTDDRPIATAKFRSNWELSTARASTVTRYLIAHGISPEHLRAVGLADTRPREANDTPEGRARNRRVSIVMFLPRGGGVRT